jgi:hypothetical protein
MLSMLLTTTISAWAAIGPGVLICRSFCALGGVRFTSGG